MFRFLIVSFILSWPLLGNSVTYYDCNSSDHTMTYRIEPCPPGEWEIRHYEVDLSIYEYSNKEHVGITTVPLDIPLINGSYIVNGSLNNNPVTFYVDTGAGMLSIGKEKAEAFGITGCLATGISTTANGQGVRNFV